MNSEIETPATIVPLSICGPKVDRQSGGDNFCYEKASHDASR